MRSCPPARICSNRICCVTNKVRCLPQSPKRFRGNLFHFAFFAARVQGALEAQSFDPARQLPLRVSRDRTRAGSPLSVIPLDRKKEPDLAAQCRNRDRHNVVNADDSVILEPVTYDIALSGVPTRGPKTVRVLTQDQRLERIRELLSGDSESLPYRVAGCYSPMPSHS